MTAIMPLYREWQTAVAQSNGPMADDERDAFVDKVLTPIEEKVQATPLATSVDLLARIRVELSYVLNDGAGHGELAALIDEHLGRVYRTSVGPDPDAQLRELADQFKSDAMAIDPTVTGMWGYYDETIDDRDSAFQGLFLERQGSPLIRRRVMAK